MHIPFVALIKFNQTLFISILVFYRLWKVIESKQFQKHETSNCFTPCEIETPANTNKFKAIIQVGQSKLIEHSKQSECLA